MSQPFSMTRFMQSAAVLAMVFGPLALSASSPARALDNDGQESIFKAVGGILGMTDDKPREEIDYRERAPLVLPPKMQLRQPQKPVAERNPAWPLDPDVEAKRRADAAARLPLFAPTVKDATRPLTKADMLRDRIAAKNANTGGVDLCSTEGRNCNRWNPNEGTNLPAAPDKLVAGQEPERSSLTDPPKGYRLATKSVKATNEAPRTQDDNSARSFYKQRPKSADE